MTMPLLPVLQYPDERLRKEAQPVDTVTDEIRTLVDNMIETMYEDRGVGLAATQVNVHKLIFVVDVSPAHNEPMVFINPKIVAFEGTVDSEEGCLSVPGIFNKVKRHKWVHVTAQDRDGKPFEVKTDTFLALVMQHEMDHLHGILFVDRLSPLKKQMALKKLEKLRKQAY